MSLLDLISDAATWDAFYEYKLSLACTKQFTGELRKFIDEKRYEPVCEGILAGRPFPLPRRSVIAKMGTDKKRVVYTYPPAENTVLKLLTWLILRKYDGVFADNLYSFRPGRTAKDAVRRLLKGYSNADRVAVKVAVTGCYAYKVDIHDYFNSIPVERLLPMLADVISDDERLYGFLAGLLTEPNVLDRGRIITERKGIMAGTPLSSFYANLYPAGLDRHFAKGGVLYARYSDDMIVFADSKEEVQARAQYIRDYLAEAVRRWTSHRRHSKN